VPFKSEKQRRYMHANHPGIARRWEHKYGAPQAKSAAERALNKKKEKK
jgi:hypothetical protein